jgi:enterochelin esterase-like enzyme
MAMLGPFAATGLAGQEASEADPVIIAHRHTVHSSVLGEDRPISVALPQGYDSTEAYPVIYVMDGPGHLVHPDRAFPDWR